MYDNASPQQATQSRAGPARPGSAAYANGAANDDDGAVLYDNARPGPKASSAKDKDEVSEVLYDLGDSAAKSSLHGPAPGAGKAGAGKAGTKLAKVPSVKGASAAVTTVGAATGTAGVGKAGAAPDHVANPTYSLANPVGTLTSQVIYDGPTPDGPGPSKDVKFPGESPLPQRRDCV